ncbi:MAG: biotin synthase auxiliary protein BsaP [Acidimicrobiales bacterium]
MTERWCSGCGRRSGDCDGSCRRPLDPPRYCPSCGRRLTVLVTPARVEARCRDHGPIGA